MDDSPSLKQKQLQETARLLIYVRQNTKTGFKISKKLYSDSNNIFCNTDYVPELCNLIRSLPEETLDKIMYDGRNPTARKLADWWERHQKADAERIAKEKQEAYEEELRINALSKLSAEEIKALGLSL
jgi:hypothetical protein